MCSEEDKEKLDELFEKYKPYLSKPGEGASLFDDWNELAPDFLVAETCRKRPSPKTV